MKVCVVSPVHTSNDVRVFHKVCKTLVKNEYEVVLYCRDKKNTVKDGVAIKSVPTLRRLFRFFYIPILFIRILREKAHCYHFNNPDALPLAILMKKMGFRVVYDTHEDFRKRILQREWIPIKFRKIISNMVFSLEKKLANIADGFFVTQEELTNIYDNAILLRNAPIIDQNFIDTVSTKSRYIVRQKPMAIYVGHSLTPARGVEQMINAIEIVNKEKEVGLWLIGKIERNYLEKISKLPGYKYVEHLSYMDYVDAMAYVKNADAGLVTILDVGDHKNSSANKLYEYMLFKTPFIASDFDKWKNEIGDLNAGIFVDPSSVNDIASAIKRIVGKETAKKNMGEIGQEYIMKEFNWNKEAKKLVNLYQRICNE
ncbi:MAG: glycosyltransferase family 4 protein [Flexistipes sinusarabici]|uniref:Glycosyltransferase family 4 protein n=1 Tax=Flexistipes sinusarabici TaxID=2352 RepID=A0A5D0MME5_FLESI|nr:glycosyltransferase [Flexistipes sinusarabici]TYB33572.1 MAG: glycosyltransferase family 4 protein [Flexistipes sinusarabici]